MSPNSSSNLFFPALYLQSSSGSPAPPHERLTRATLSPFLSFFGTINSFILSAPIIGLVQYLQVFFLEHDELYFHLSSILYLHFHRVHLELLPVSYTHLTLPTKRIV